MSARAKGTLTGKSGLPHEVELRVQPGEGQVVVELHRASRQRAAGDQRLVLTPTAARLLMRALQGGADEADRLEYAAAKRRGGESIDEVVDAVARALGGAS